MVTRAQIEKLGAMHAVEPTILSLYLAVPPSANLTARAGELIAAAEAACGRPLAARDRDWVLEKLPPCARDCTGRTVAVFTCAGSGLFEAIPLPCPLPERGVLGVRPHIRPLLLARQRCSVPYRLRPTSPGRPKSRPAAQSPRSWPYRPPPARRRPARLPGRGQRRARSDPGRPGRRPGPRYECGRCGTLSLDADTCCPDWGIAALPVPDVIEEMVSRVLEDGGDVLVAGGGWSPPRVRLF